MTRHARMSGRTIHASRGYNLVEVLIAMAILGVVMISIFSLFIMGRRNVYSGKQMTQAVAVGTQVMEDFAGLNKKMIYNGCFNIADADTGTDITIPTPTSRTFAHAKIRSTDPNVIASAPSDISTENGPTSTQPGPGLMAKWQTLLAGSSKLTKGSVTVILQPDQDSVSPDRFKDAPIMRIYVLVRWKEAGRVRQLQLDTIKSY